MGQGGAFVELITVRRGAYARRYIQTALKVVAINPRGSPFTVLATRLFLSSAVFPTRYLSVSESVLLADRATLPRDTSSGVLGVLIGEIRSPAHSWKISPMEGRDRRSSPAAKIRGPNKGRRRTALTPPRPCDAS